MGDVIDFAAARANPPPKRDHRRKKKKKKNVRGLAEALKEHGSLTGKVRSPEKDEDK